MTKWLDVTQHPPRYTRVLCLTATGRVELCEVIADYQDGETTYYEQTNGTPITHWMPVPEGVQEEEFIEPFASDFLLYKSKIYSIKNKETGEVFRGLTFDAIEDSDEYYSFHFYEKDTKDEKVVVCISCSNRHHFSIKEEA
jgi:hypothetical protein